MPTDPTTQTPDAHAVSEALSAAGAPQGAADAHGLLCALLCVDPGLRVDAWLERLGAARTVPADDALEALHALTRAQLVGERFDLAPWLPDDDAPLDDRALALGEWCQGFLGGLGLAGVDPAHLGGDATEFVDDLATIAQAAVGSGADVEGAERDYAELVEFLRIGTYLVRDALHPAPAAGTPS